SSAPTAWRTAVSKWLRIGQPGVVSDTVTRTRPSAVSIERTISSSTIERRSSGSMTASRALRISSREGMPVIQAGSGRGPAHPPRVRTEKRPAPGGPFLEGGEVLPCRRGMWPAVRPSAGALRRPDGEAGLRDVRDALLDPGRDLRAAGDAGLHEVLDAGAD